MKLETADAEFRCDCGRVVYDEIMTEAERALLKLYRQQVTTWLNRARMADNYSNFDLTRQALDKCWQYQRSIAELKKLSFEVERPQSPDDVASWLKEFGE